MRKLKLISSCLTAVLVSSLLLSCSPNQRIVESNGQWSNTEANRAAATPVQNSLESEIEAMRTADFIFIYVIKRKDGGPLDTEDRKFAGAVIPGEMNRRTVADGGKAILIGSNFRMPDESMKLISERFAVEDLSREVPPTANINAKANK
jgi:hypothetical protein